jgi:hypothetical protein
MTTEPLSPQPDPDPRGFKGLPPFVDVVYGAVLGFGVFKIEEAIRKAGIPARGNDTPLFLLMITSIYLMFDYAQARMCTEKNCYKALTRYALDVFIAIAFVFAYVEAYDASVYYLFSLSILLCLGALWIRSLDKEYPHLKLRLKLLTNTHYFAAAVLLLLLSIRLAGILEETWDRWINVAVGSAFLIYSFVLSLVTHDTDLTELERGLLPIIPLYAPIRAFKRAFHFGGPHAG